MWDKAKSLSRLTYDLFVAAGKEFGADKVSRMAAAVAYRTMFALAPLFLLAVWILRLALGSDEQARLEILNRIEAYAGGQIAEALDVFLESVEVSGGTAAVVGVALLLWTASSLFMELQRDLNDIFHVPEERVQGVVASIRKRAIGFLWVFGVGLALTAVWLLNAVWRFFGDEILPAGAENLHFVVGLLTPLVSVVLLPVIFGLFLQTMTAVRIRWRAIWWGSLFTSVAFLAAAYGVGLYFSWDSETSASQVAASLFVVLLLAFVLATVFFLGAEVTKVYDDYLDHGDVKAPSERLRHVPEAVVSQPEPAMPMAAVFGFLGGLFVGWRRRS